MKRTHHARFLRCVILVIIVDDDYDTHTFFNRSILFVYERERNNN